MTVRIEGAAMPPDETGMRAVRTFAYVVEDAGVTDTDIRDANHCREIAGRLCGDGIAPGPPSPSATPLWRVYVRVTKSRRGRAVYSCDHEKLDGCPTGCAADMMDLYKDVKRVLRKARKTVATGKDC